MKIKILLFLIIFFSCQRISFAFSNKVLMKKDKLAFYTPHIINPKYFAFEFGFITSKKISSIDYPFHAFAEGFLAEESYTVSNQLRSGALGFKGGVLLPTQPWLPIFLYAAIGFAKTALHEDPWFGRKEQSSAIKDMFLAEGGIMFRYQKIIFRLSYQENTIKYFKKKTLFSLGVNF